MKSKPDQPQIAFFLPQYENMMLNAPGYSVTTRDDLCRFAAGECGITGIDIPIGMIDVKRMLSDTEFREKTVAHYRDLGTPIVRLSSHTDGQLRNLNSIYLDRFEQFGPKAKRGRRYNARQHERLAQERIEDGLRLQKLLDSNFHQTFPGGRAVPHLDQWSTLPENFRQYALMQLAAHWEPTIRVAKECGVRLGFEIGHVMEGITSIDDFDLFRSYLPEDLREWVVWGVDTSHFDKVGDDGAAEVQKAMDKDLDGPGHGKDAICEAPAKGRHGQYGLPFSEQSGKFVTFGTGNAKSAAAFGEVLWREHERREQGTHAVLEGEDMIMLNPFQAMKVGAENLRLVIAGKEPRPMSDIELAPWNGATFETFAKSGVPVSSLLQLSREELRTLRRMARQHGLTLPS